MVNVLVFGLFGGSHYKNAKEMAKYLKDQKRSDGGYRYNVTMLVWNENMDF